ncbi:MAG: hypothetical protein LBO09_02195 [Candidatus Peribacteria bacterium]|nr:hypothetical protein [Candidatus Peribacteria bacterium]
MKKVRPHQEVIGRLNLTVATKEKESYYLAELEKRYEELYGEKFDYNFVAIQSLLLYHTDTLTSKKKKTPIKEVIERYRDWDCF